MKTPTCPSPPSPPAPPLAPPPVIAFVDVPREDCGVALNLLLRLVVRAVGYSPRAQHIFSEVNLWPKTIRSKLNKFSARRGDRHQAL